jgi:hypothetical protein
MKVLHILDHSVPLFSGYTFRSHSIIQAQRASGLQPVVLTSPKHGSPSDGMEDIDGIQYYRTAALEADALSRMPFAREIKLMARIARHIEAVAKKAKADWIHSQSPREAGLSALWRTRHCYSHLSTKIERSWKMLRLITAHWRRDYFITG